MVRNPTGMKFREWVCRLGVPIMGWDSIMYLITQHHKPNVSVYNLLSRRWDLVVTDIEDVRFILDNSPSTFGVGSDKKAVFSFFMKQNVGISTPDEWVQRRALNAYALHVLPPTDWMTELLETSKWDSFQSIERDMSRICMRLVFGPKFTDDTTLIGELQRLMIKGNNFKLTRVDEREYTAYYDAQSSYVSQLCPDNKGSFVQRALVWEQENPDQDGCLVEQIPHWMFPIAGAGSNSITKTLILLTSSPTWQDRCRSSKVWCTRAILETLRLWPTVRSQLRECMKPVTIGGVDVPKGTQILLSNSVLHRPLQSSTAHRFNPANFLHPEKGVFAPHIVSFNAFGNGPQACPGRDVATLFSTEVLYFMLQKWTFLSHNKQFLDVDHVLLDINFTNIQFNCVPR